MSAPARFEGSFLGDATRISDAARLECKICWTPYDPAQGDEVRQIPPGTPFRALPADWRCPVCDGEKAQFMVVEDRPAPPAVGQSSLEALLRSEPPRLVAAFREIYNAKMRDVPLVNRALHVEAIGFRIWEGRLLGVLVAPWFMNLVLLPGPADDWSGLRPGDKELIEFPAGFYEFCHNVRPEIGGYKACSLFSPMEDFASQLQASDVARAVMVALFDPANRVVEETAPSVPSNAVTAGQPTPAPTQPSRRAFLTAGLDAARS